MELVFNELCVDSNISSISKSEEAKACINNFVNLLYSLSKENLITNIESTEYFRNIEVSPEYKISSWLEDPSVKREHKQFFLRTMDKKVIYINTQDLESEFSIEIEGKEYTSVNLAKVIEGELKSLSIKTNDFFCTGEIRGVHRFFNCELDDLDEEDKFFYNIADDCDIKSLKEVLKKEEYINITSGQDLWEERKKLFSKLVFCECVKKQLYEDPEKTHIIAIMKRLELLQKYYDNYEEYNIENFGYGVRTESYTVKTNKKLREQRKFKKPDGKYEYFYDHISFTGKFSGGRIYFIPDNAERKFYVGYIGRHLPTSKY